ncbi:MAG: endonuclease/exonuclease/phosphatase family protein [Bacteroidia bacterium]|jgi:endonuclease/exonuclease/phosphatase (EEP) superfamily protein YafD|nr:endonuclease/exonuclease/phosphatase family protein [Bacteroidia bacterium]
MRRLFKRIADFINSLAILGLLIAYLAPFVDPQDFWPVSFFGLTYTFWLILNLLLVFFWISLKKRRWMYNAFFILMGLQFAARNIQFNSSSAATSDIKVATFNVNVQQVYNGGNTSEQIRNCLNQKQFDVAVLIEWLNKKGSIDYDTYPHQQFVKLDAKKNKYDYGLKIVSKHKIINWERIKYEHFTNNIAAYFDIDINGTVVRYVATHLQSNGINSSLYHKLVNVEIDEEYKSYALNFAKRLKKLIVQRSEQTKAIQEVIADSPYPVIILGDFNDTHQSYTYQQLKKGRKDAFIERGNGWGATYLKPFPIMRIDYILHDSELECTSYKCVSTIKSDHAMVEATFKLSN